jgi:hypothetical protein
MRSRSSIQLVLLLSALAGLTACAGSGGEMAGAAEPSGDGIAVQVSNDISPPASVVIWAVNENGMRRRLGPVPPNGRRSFTYDPQTRDQLVHLVAEVEGPTTGTMRQAGERVSNEFSIIDVQSVSWTVSRRNVQIGG